MTFILHVILIGICIGYFGDTLVWLFPYASSEIEWFVTVTGILMILDRLPDHE